MDLEVVDRGEGQTLSPYAGVVDENNVVYTYQQGALEITLPGGGGIVVAGFENGDLGITYNVAAVNAVSASAEMDENGQLSNISYNAPLSAVAFDSLDGDFYSLPAPGPGDLNVPTTFLPALEERAHFIATAHLSGLSDLS